MRVIGGGGLFIGIFGFGVRRDLFTAWLDCGVISIGFTSPVAKARIEEVARRAQQIKDALPALAGKVRR